MVIVDDATGFETALARVAEARRAVPRASVILLSSTWTTAISLEPRMPESTRRFAEVPTRSASARSSATCSPAMSTTPSHGAQALPARPVPRPIAGLTSRELEILRLVAAGSSNGTIARALWITEQTVKFHLSNVYRKLGVANRTQASRFAHLNGLVDDVETPRALPAAA